MRHLDQLNDAQKEAVMTIEGPVMVLAGAGSGKTRVLTSRIYHLIRNGVRPESILAITFTNKAAREMRERLGKLLGEEVAVWKREGVPFVATFHGLGRELLESYGKVLGLPRHFTIYDRDDSERAIKNALKELGIDPKEVPPRSILARISRAKGEGLDRDAFTQKHGREGFRGRIASDVWRLYEEALAKEKALDFDDLIYLPVRLLEQHPDVRTLVQEHFRYVNVDEYQDTSALQGRLVRLIAGDTKNVFVVGDIDQCIYTWRQATIENLLEFEHEYTGAKLIVLEHNYRSSKTIVDAANQIIEKNRNRKEKRSVTSNPEGEPIRIHMAGTAEDEARFVAREAAALVRDGMKSEDIAVLYRTNFQSRVLEEAFLSSGMPYRLLGTQFYDRKEVKDVLSWTRLALDSSREADLVRAVQSPPRGIGKVTLGKIAIGAYDALKPAERSKVEAFQTVLARLNEAAKMLPPSELVRLVIEESGMRASYEKGGDDDLERLENAKELATIASRHDGMRGEAGLAAFLADAALAGDQDELDRKKEKKGVTLMTVHAAKGLEFGAVFVTGLEEGLFPHEGMGDEDRDEEEERRLFYVALTRAKERAYLTLARVRRIYGTDYLQDPSSFLSDIDASLVKYAHEEQDEVVIEA